MRGQLEGDDLSTTMALRKVGATQQEFVSFTSVRAVAGSASSEWTFGARASRPSTAAIGDRYLATDIGTLGGWLYYWTGLAWEIVVGWAFGTDAQRSALSVSSVDNGAVFYTTDTTKLWTVSGGAWVDRSAATGATTTEPFVTIGNTSGLSAERALTGTANQIVVTDNGANSTAVLSTPQNIHTGANPTFAGIVSSTAGRFAMRRTTPAQITSDQNDYNPGTGGFFRIRSDASRNVTGILAGVDGEMIYLANFGSFNIVLQNLNAGSAAANRILTGTGADVILVPDDTAILIYDSVTAVWRQFT